MKRKKRRKKPNKDTKAYQKWELRIKKNKCLHLWSVGVRERAVNKCEYCGSKDQVHAHHIEDSRLNSALRYDLRNGAAFCAKHHKFGPESAHKSFIFMYRYMVEHRKEDLEYLLQERERKVELTKEYLELKIKELEVTGIK